MRCRGHHKDGVPGTCALCWEPRSTTCDRPLRGGGICAMDRNHRGRCSSVVFTCDGCAKRRRGTAHSRSTVYLGDGTVDDVFEFCFMCSVVNTEPEPSYDHPEWGDWI